MRVLVNYSLKYLGSDAFGYHVMSTVNMVQWALADVEMRLLVSEVHCFMYSIGVRDIKLHCFMYLIGVRDVSRKVNMSTNCNYVRTKA